MERMREMKRAEYAFRSAHARAVAEVGPQRLTESPQDHGARIIARMQENARERFTGMVRTLALSGQIEGSR